MINICMCGMSAGGYPHKPACPRPLYRGSDVDIANWKAEYNLRRQSRQALSDFGVVEPTLTELQTKDPDTINAWIIYIKTQRRLDNPAGYLINQLRAGHEPPPPPANKYERMIEDYGDAIQY